MTHGIFSDFFSLFCCYCLLTFLILWILHFFFFVEWTYWILNYIYIYFLKNYLLKKIASSAKDWVEFLDTFLYVFHPLLRGPDASLQTSGLAFTIWHVRNRAPGQIWWLLYLKHRLYRNIQIQTKHCDQGGIFPEASKEFNVSSVCAASLEIGRNGHHPKRKCHRAYCLWSRSWLLGFYFDLKLA